MRILFIGPFSPPRGGVQAHLTALHEYILARGISCQVIDLSPGRKSDGRGVYGPRNAIELARLLLTLHYDISHLHIGGDLTTRDTALALLCATLPGRRSVLTFHSGGYPSSPKGRAATPNSFRGFALRRLDRVVAVNEEIAAWFRQVGVREDRIRLIHPYSLPATPPNVDLPEPLLSFVTQHGPILVSVGGLETEYDLPLQIEVLGQLRDKFPRAGLIIVGSGSIEADLRLRVAEKSYSEHILLSGDVDRSLALRIIADSDLMLRTTLYDGDSIAVREAVHFGVPVVATDRAPRPAGVRVVPAQDLPRLGEAAAESLSNGGRRPPSDEPREENFETLLALYEEVMKVG